MSRQLGGRGKPIPAWKEEGKYAGLQSTANDASESGSNSRNIVLQVPRIPGGRGKPLPSWKTHPEEDDRNLHANAQVDKTRKELITHQRDMKPRSKTNTASTTMHTSRSSWHHSATPQTQEKKWNQSTTQFKRGGAVGNKEHQREVKKTTARANPQPSQTRHDVDAQKNTTPPVYPKPGKKWRRRSKQNSEKGTQRDETEEQKKKEDEKLKVQTPKDDGDHHQEKAKNRRRRRSKKQAEAIVKTGENPTSRTYHPPPTTSPLVITLGKFEPPSIDALSDHSHIIDESEQNQARIQTSTDEPGMGDLLSSINQESTENNYFIAEKQQNQGDNQESAENNYFIAEKQQNQGDNQESAENNGFIEEKQKNECDIDDASYWNDQVGEEEEEEGELKMDSHYGDNDYICENARIDAELDEEQVPSGLRSKCVGKLAETGREGETHENYAKKGILSEAPLRLPIENLKMDNEYGDNNDYIDENERINAELDEERRNENTSTKPITLDGTYVPIPDDSDDDF